MKLESEQCLKKLLTKLGVTDMFQDTKANLKGMSDKALYVSKAAHKAIIEVGGFIFISPQNFCNS